MGINTSTGALKPELAEAVRRFLAECSRQNFPVVIIETDRSQAVQDAYYAQGRRSLEEVNRLRQIAGLYLLSEAENKKTCTDAKASNHTGGNAVDIAPVMPKKPGWAWWSAPQDVWEKMGSIAEECGLDWCAGGYGKTWGKGWDNPHFELP